MKIYDKNDQKQFVKDAIASINVHKKHIYFNKEAIEFVGGLTVKFKQDKNLKWWICQSNESDAIKINKNRKGHSFSCSLLQKDILDGNKSTTFRFAEKNAVPEGGELWRLLEISGEVR